MSQIKRKMFDPEFFSIPDFIFNKHGYDRLVNLMVLGLIKLNFFVGQSFFVTYYSENTKKACSR